MGGWVGRWRTALGVGADVITVALGVGGLGAAGAAWFATNAHLPPLLLALLMGSIFCVLAGVSGRLWYVYRPGLPVAPAPTGQPEPNTVRGAPVTRVEGSVLGERLRAVTGETLVRHALSVRGPTVNVPVFLFGKRIPVWELLDLKLAEVVLLRRMTARLQLKRAGARGYETMSERLAANECEGILLAGGISHSRQSLVRLEGRHLIGPERDGERSITEGHGAPRPETGGTALALDFAACMLRDPFLVAAYRKVALEVDKVIQIEADGNLVGGEHSYENWLNQFLA